MRVAPVTENEAWKQNVTFKISHCGVYCRKDVHQLKLDADRGSFVIQDLSKALKKRKNDNNIHNGCLPKELQRDTTHYYERYQEMHHDK